MASALKSKILSAFNIHGYSLRSDASKYLQDVLGPLDEEERSAAIKQILDFVQHQSLTSALIDKILLEQAVDDCTSGSNEEEICLNVIDAFSLPQYFYHDDTRKFIPRSSVTKTPPSLFGKAESKADIYVKRYKMIHQRVSRHELFAPPAIATDNKKGNYFSLKSVEHLLGSSTNKKSFVVLGMLTQLKEGHFYLEDPTGAVKLNLSHSIYKEGLFTENSIILAEGYYEDEVFHVTTVGFPPSEPASVTLSNFPYLDMSLAASTTSYRLSEKLKSMESKHSDAMFIFLSDVWLDQLKVMQRLHVLLAGYSQFPPTCFVMIGNFLSISNAGSQSKTLQECFEKLGNLISDFPPLISKSTFVFVPGPDDPGLPHILPRPPIPEAILTEFRKKIPNAIFTSNPCRIQYCSQEILVFREDILSKMCRNSIYMPWQSKEKVAIPDLFVKTVIGNSHLLPLPLHVAPIYWEYDNVFWLYPLPDVVVCADKSDPYTITSTDTIFFNPGSLPRNGFSFKVYVPASREVEDSEIIDDQSG